MKLRTAVISFCLGASLTLFSHAEKMDVFSQDLTHEVTLPYDVDSAFYFVKNAWGLRDQNDLINEGGQQWVTQKIKDKTWRYESKPGNRYFIIDNNTLQAHDGNEYAFSVEAEFIQTASGNTKLRFRQFGISPDISSKVLINALIRDGYESEFNANTRVAMNR